QDSDNDGLTNLDEYLNQTHPLSSDGDNDGFSDTWELTNGFNPNDANVPLLQMITYNSLPIAAVSILTGMVTFLTYSQRLLVKRKYKILQQEIVNKNEEIQNLLNDLLEDA
ncbi:MAG: thrombospondin type 3 repeat-containing protein, partial [Candidatus Thorarchaeota archaeon]